MEKPTVTECGCKLYFYNTEGSLDVECTMDRSACEVQSLRTQLERMLKIVCEDGGFQPCESCKHQTCQWIREAKHAVGGVDVR